LPWQLVAVIGEMHEAQRLVDALLGLGGGHAAHLQAEAHIPSHRHVREERIVLKHHAEAAFLGAQGVDALVVEPDAAAGHRQQPGNAIERRRLAAARRAEQGHELAAADREREIAQGVDGAEIAAHPVEAQFLEGWRARGLGATIGTAARLRRRGLHCKVHARASSLTASRPDHYGWHRGGGRSSTPS